MYPKGMVKLYSNGTPRSFKHMNTDSAVFFGLQYYIKEYLINQWNELFFDKDIEPILSEYRRFHKHFSFVDIETTHIEKLHALGYLPISIKALPEGSKVKEKVPFYTIVNTHPDHAWLVNFLETQMSTVIWDLCVNATIGYQYRSLLDQWAIKTTGSKEFVQWQGHDFSMRGRSSVESSFNQAGWLLSFTGTDTIPAVLMLEEYYNANIEKELVGSSVPASEHSVMTSYGKEEEIDAFRRLLSLFPSGILSVVSDSFDLWKVCTEFMVELKEEILARDGKLVIRPDSGDPVDIICGTMFATDSDSTPRQEGVIDLLWDVFGGTVNDQGYKVLDPHIGAIYGDSIDLKRADTICERLSQKGFASTNIVFGVGSYTFNYNTRDSIGFAVKSTYCEVLEDGSSEPVAREIFKDPITDSGIKKSAKGMLAVFKDDKGDFFLNDQCTYEMESSGELVPVFSDGFLLVDQSLSEIRARLASN
jgi:nicotinamide phosphoribosyltransferase